MYRMDGLDTLSTSVPSLDGSSIRGDGITNTSAPSSCREEISSQSSHQALGILKEEGPQFRTPIKNKVKKSCVLSCIYTIQKSMNVSVFLINSKYK